MRHLNITRNQTMAAVVVFVVVLSIASIMAVSFKVGTDHRQDTNISDVRVALDKESEARIEENERINALQSKQIEALRLANIKSNRIGELNRKLIIAVLKLRDRNPGLFVGITLPTVAGYVIATAPQRITKVPAKPKKTKPVKPRPKPAPHKPEITAPTPTPTAPAPVAPVPSVPPTPGVPPIPIVPKPVPPVISLPGILQPILGPLLPPILRPILG